jgi:hypothetical protein
LDAAEGIAVMRETKKQIEDSQDVRDEAFLQQHSSRSSSAEVTLDQVREQLAKMLEIARAETKAVDPTARTFAAGHAAGLEDAIKLIDKVLQAEQAARIKAAAPGV